MSKKTTMTDIAKALGVSQTLVSFVLSGKNDMGISADTKKKVLTTAEKMGYCSSYAAKMIKLGRCGYAAIVFEKSPGSSLSEVISGINSAFSQYGYSLILCGSPDGGIDIAECKKLFSGKKTDGFIVFGEADALTSTIGSDLPVVSLTDCDEASAKGCALKLCEKILACEPEKKKTRSNSKTRRTASKKAVNKSLKEETAVKTDTAEKAAANQKKNESIWLL